MEKLEKKLEIHIPKPGAFADGTYPQLIRK